jgi:hypothetical protein
MSFRSFFAVTAFAVVAGAGTVAAPAKAEAAAPTRTESCSAFTIQKASTANVFKSQGTLESALRKDASIPIYIPKLCCYKYLGCFLC